MRHENPLEIFPYGDPPPPTLPTGKLGKLTPSPPGNGSMDIFLEPHNYSMYTTEIQKQFIKNYVIDPQRFDKLCSDTQSGLLIQKVDNSSKGVLIYNNALLRMLNKNLKNI